MPADQNAAPPSPAPDARAADAQTPSADPAELTQAQLDAVSGGVGAMQMTQPRSVRAMGDLQWGDPHEKAAASDQQG